MSDTQRCREHGFLMGMWFCTDCHREGLLLVVFELNFKTVHNVGGEIVM